ncbi:MAG: helix-turn-helix transcriptional regulator [Ilumatobacteraceae bacterium]
MAGDKEPTPLERSLAVARLFYEEARPITLTELQEALPEYAAEKDNSAFSKFKIDRKVLETEARIAIEWSDEEQAYVLPSPFFTPHERRALVDAARAVALDGLDDVNHPRAVGAEVDARSAVVAVRVPAILDELQVCVSERRLVRFSYTGKDRTVQPWRIGQWRDDWYLIALEVDGAVPKRFALDRIQPVGDEDVIAGVGAAGSFVVPEDVDWDAQFSLDPNVWGPDPEITVRIRIADAFRPLFADAFDEWRPTVREGDDIVVEIPARHHESTIIRLLSFGDHIELLGPDEFIDKMRAWLAPQAEVR